MAKKADGPASRWMIQKCNLKNLLVFSYSLSPDIVTVLYICHRYSVSQPLQEDSEWHFCSSGINHTLHFKEQFFLLLLWVVMKAVMEVRMFVVVITAVGVVYW
jgi:hypothetical protein